MSEERNAITAQEDMKQHCKYLLCLMFALLLGIPMTQGKETTEVNYASGSSYDFIMGEFEAVRYDEPCEKKVVTIYEIEGSPGSYYALIDGEKYKVQYGRYNDANKSKITWEVRECDSRSTYTRSHYYCIVYKGVKYVFNMPI